MAKRVESPASEDGDSPTQWKYEIVEPPRDSTMEETSDPKDLLNEYGREDWELVDTITYSGGSTSSSFSNGHITGTRADFLYGSMKAALNVEHCRSQVI